jgi:hypothetical protein
MPYLLIFIFLLVTSFACTNGPSSTSLYKAKGGKQNTPYDDNRMNNKELKEHQKQAQKRQKAIDQVDHVERDPSHGAKDVGAAKEKKK